MRASLLAVEAHDLAKTFRSGWLRRRETPALRGASLRVERGAIFGLLGPNGAGKTTLLSILATLLLPDGGSARILGHDVVREAFAIRRRLNMASGNASFVWSLRPAEVLSFYGRLYGLHGRTLRTRVGELLERFELTPHLKTEYNELSTGKASYTSPGVVSVMKLWQSFINDGYMSNPGVTTDPAPTSESSPMTAPSSTMLPMPMRHL